jgi:hypothetical protein
MARRGKVTVAGAGFHGPATAVPGAVVQAVPRRRRASSA